VSSSFKNKLDTPDGDPKEKQDTESIKIEDIILRPVSETFKSKKTLTRIPHGRPRPFDQVRVHPGLPMTKGLSQVLRQIQLGIIKRENDKDGRRYEYACSSAVTAQYEDRKLVVRHTCYLAQYRSSGAHFLWTIKTPNYGKLHQSSETQLEIAEESAGRWLGIEYDNETGTNNKIEPDAEVEATYTEPVWEIESWLEAIRLAFPGNELITDIHNPIILEMLAKARPR
jgi:hypothetical protein